jgi:hypothetical protein
MSELTNAVARYERNKETKRLERVATISTPKVTVPISYIDKLQTTIAKLEQELFVTRTQSQWISVADEVPKIGQNYDGYHYSGRHANCGAFIGTAWDEKSIRETMQIKGYSHWMQLPTCPTTDK